MTLREKLPRPTDYLNPGEYFQAGGPGDDKFQGMSMLLIGLYKGNRGQAVLLFLICNQDGSLRFYEDSDSNSAQRHMDDTLCLECGECPGQCKCRHDCGMLES